MVGKLFAGFLRPGIAAPRIYRTGRLTSMLIFAFVAVRKISALAGREYFPAALILLASFLFLLIVEPHLVRRRGWYQPVFYLLQGSLILALGLLSPYEDTWAILYIPVTMSVWYETPRPKAKAWSILFTACLTVTMLITFGWLEGLGYVLTYLSAGIICISYGIVVAEAEIAQAESQKLLADLQKAHGRLQEYAARVEELAAAQERDRLARELHDSVSQAIFSISLNAQAAQMLLEKDPGRLPEQLDRLQELTGQALSRMRALITQWRPG